MRKQAPNLDWQIAESDADWEQLYAPVVPDITPDTSRCRRLKYCFWGVAALLLLLTTGGPRWWRIFPTRTQQTAAEVTTAQPVVSGVAQRPDQFVTSAVSNQSDADWWLQHGREVLGLRAAIQTSDPDGHLDLALDTVDVQRDQAVARVVMYTEHGEPAYRQTRFYRRTEEGWQQTEPDAALWGQERSLESLFVTFYFRQQDAPAVSAVAAQVNNLYTTLRRNLGLPLKAWEEKLVINIRVTQSPGHAASQLPGSDRLMVASPAVYLAPVELTDADLLAQSIALPLLDDVLAQAQERHAIGPSWWPLLAGLRLWQLWDLDLPLATWRTEVVRWVYAAEPAIPPGQPLALPVHYEELCAAHTRWMSAPVQLGIPLLCTEVDWKNRYFAAWGPHDPPMRLNQLAMSTSPNEYIGQAASSYVSHPGQTVALATLIDYAVATYGRERLPALVAGLGQYDRWDTLIPAVYGVSASEFEQGWQKYLVAHYGISSPP